MNDTEITIDRMSRRKSRWRRFVSVMVTLVVLVVVGGWFGVRPFVKARVFAQLQQLGLGQAQIGDAWFSFTGIEVSDICFSRDSSQEHQLTIDRLSIMHSLSGLIAGDTRFDAIQITGLSTSIDLDSPLADETMLTGFESLVLPANRIQIKNATVRLKQGDQPEFLIDDIVAQIRDDSDVSTSPKISISGGVNSMANAKWYVQGEINPGENRLIANLHTDRLTLNDRLLQTAPYLYPKLIDSIRANGQVSCRVSITMDETDGFQLTGSVVPTSLALFVPTFQMPIKILEGEIGFDTSAVYYRDIVATVDGIDRINGNGKTNVNQWPIVSTFAGTFKDVEMAAWRMMVPSIPLAAVGRSNGTTTGRVEVQSDLGTVLKIDADGASQNGRYGQIDAEALTAEVRIRDLAFDENQQYQSVDGHVLINATSGSQPIQNVFQTFQLGSLNRQLRLAGNSVAKVALRLPLATADDLTTWDLNIDGKIPSATFANQSLKNVSVTAKLHQGDLVLKPIAGTPRQKTDAKYETEPSLNVGVVWPIALSSGPQQGLIEVQGRAVPVPWLDQILQNQFSNANGTNGIAGIYNVAKGEMPALHGQVDFQASVTVPVDQPQLLNGWVGEGKITAGEIGLLSERLREIQTGISLGDGLLTLANFNASFGGNGSVVGIGTIDIANNRHHALSLSSHGATFDWLARVAKELLDEMAADGSSAVDLSQILPLNNSENSNAVSLPAGELAIDLVLDSRRDGKNPNSGNLANANDSTWNLVVNASSDSLIWPKESISKFKLGATVDARSLQVDEMLLSLRGDEASGQLTTVHSSLRWDFIFDSLNATVTWKNLRIDTVGRLASFISGIGDIASLGGLTNGSARFERNANQRASGSYQPVSISGTAEVHQLSSDFGQISPWQFNFSTSGSDFCVDQLRLVGSDKTLGISGKIGTSAPFPFSLKGSLDRLDLNQLMSKARGDLSGDFAFTGDIESLRWTSAGDLAITGTEFNGRTLEPISASWKNIGSQADRSTIKIEAFGGAGQLVTRASQTKKQNLVLKFNGVDTSQIASLAGVENQIAGTLDGDVEFADLGNWIDPAYKVRATGAAISIDDYRLRDVQLDVNVDQQQIGYAANGKFLTGTWTADGQANRNESNKEEPFAYPVNIQVKSVPLSRLQMSSNRFRSSRRLGGDVSASTALMIQPGKSIVGNGRLEFDNVKLDNKLVTRKSSMQFRFDQSTLFVQDIATDLSRGAINARARIPLNGRAAGTWQVEIRQMDVKRLVDIFSSEEFPVQGYLDARLNGRLGDEISGQGTLGLERTRIRGVSGQSLRLPVQFSYSIRNTNGRIDLRRSTFRLFEGNASGTASIQFGRRLGLKTDLRFSNMNASKMFGSIVGNRQGVQGKLAGRLVLGGSDIRSLRDLKGSFRGNLQRAAALRFPVLEDLANFLAGNSINTRDYQSEEIDLRLDRGRIAVNQLNLSNPLTRIAITGDVYLDGRLDLDVAARVERLNQPTLIDEILGSPLARLTGSPAAFFADAADFLSERIVFLDVRGTFRRPQIRIDAAQQLREEVIRYFLRGSQILPEEIDR